jgi:hypothetical protein
MLTRRLAAGHDISFGLGLANFSQDAEAVAQNVKTRLLLLAGEWFLDAGAGLPYLRDIVIKPANIQLAQSLIKRRILETDGVASISDFAVSFDSNTRGLTVSVTVKTIYEDQTTIKVNLE